MKIPRQAYTIEFKERAVKRANDGQSISTVIQELWRGDQTLRHWVKASTEGKLKGAGRPRRVQELRARGFSARKERIERLMRDNGIRARHKRRTKVTTDSKHGLPVAANLLGRNFTPAAPNKVWTSDITYLWTDEGGLYLAIVLDLFNREVVGCSLKPSMTAEIVTEALTLA